MKTQKITFAGANNLQLPGCLWSPDSEPKVILQIAHGMTEHIGRYQKLAEVLTEKGILVAGFDLRGHGENLGNPDVASMGENGWQASLEDIHLFYQYLEARFENKPHFILGFSLGSFLVREYLSDYEDKIAGAIIMGTGHQPKAALSAIMAVVKTQIGKAGFDQTTPLVQKLSFETYNQKFKPNKTSFDWLCSDENELAKYCADSKCKENISAGLFWQLLGSMKRSGDKHAYDNWAKDMPVLLISGEMDPVGDFGKGVEQVKQNMEKAGMEKVTLHMFAGARHDLLHEKENGSSKRAMEMLTDWIL